jgi:hypothetical protein
MALHAPSPHENPQKCGGEYRQHLENLVLLNVDLAQEGIEQEGDLGADIARVVAQRINVALKGREILRKHRVLGERIRSGSRNRPTAPGWIDCRAPLLSAPEHGPTALGSWKTLRPWVG